MENYTLGKRQQKQTNKKTGIAILIANKTDFKPNKITKDKDGYYVTLKETSHQEVITLIP